MEAILDDFDTRLSALPGTYRPLLLSQRDLRNHALPTVAASPPTFTTSAAAAASAITCPVHWTPDTPSAFSIHGAQMVEGGGIGGSVQGLLAYGASAGAIASPSPYEVEFEVDTVHGTVEIIAKDTASNVARLAVDGTYATPGSTFRARPARPVRR